MNNLKVPISTDFFTFEKKLKSLGDLQHIPIIEIVPLIDPDKGTYVLIQTNSKTFVQPLNMADATYYSAFTANCHENLHIPTIYQLYLDIMREMGNQIETIVIEAVKGDIVYSRVTWKSRKGRFFTNLCSLGDALILSKLTDTSIYIVKPALDAFEEYENSNSHYNFYEVDDDSEYEEYDDDED